MSIVKEDLSNVVYLCNINGINYRIGYGTIYGRLKTINNKIHTYYTLRNSKESECINLYGQMPLILPSINSKLGGWRVEYSIE